MKDYFCRFLPHIPSLLIPLASLNLCKHCLVSAGSQRTLEVDDTVSAMSGCIDTGLSVSGYTACGMTES